MTTWASKAPAKVYLVGAGPGDPGLITVKGRKILERADSILVASEPLTRDTSSWVELPEYGALFAEVRAGRPRLSLRLLD